MPKTRGGFNSRSGSEKSARPRNPLLLGATGDHNPRVQPARTFRPEASITRQRSSVSGVWRLRRHHLGLLLTCLMAGCGSSLPSDVPLGGTVPPVEDEPRRPESPERGPRFEVSGNEGGAVADDEDSDIEDEDSDTIEITAEPTAPAAPGEAAPQAKPVPGCDDSGGTVPACGDLQSGACGAVFDPLCQQLGRVLKPKVAGAVVACLIENNRSSRCDAIQECLDNGLEKACVSADDRRVCQSVGDRCGKPAPGSVWEKPEKCAQGVASLKKSVRAKLVKCLESSCDLDRCFLRIAE